MERMIIDRPTRQIIIDGQRARPPRGVFDILDAMTRHPEVVYSPQQVLDIAGKSYSSLTAASCVIKKARKFLAPYDMAHHLRTSYSVGYYWTNDRP